MIQFDPLFRVLTDRNQLYTIKNYVCLYIYTQWSIHAIVNVTDLLKMGMSIVVNMDPIFHLMEKNFPGYFVHTIGVASLIFQVSIRSYF
jgi:hypothetical protein